MAEKYIVIEGEAVSFEGFFEIKGLVSAIKDWSLDNQYDFYEKKRTESVKENGKSAKIEYLNGINVSDYTKLIMKIKVELTGIKDAVIDLNGKRKRVQKGNVSVKFEGIVETDYEGRWEKMPFMMFIRSLFDRYIYKSITHWEEKKLRTDIDSLKKHITEYFNVFKV